MDEEILRELMGEIDDKYIMEAQEYVPHKKKRYLAVPIAAMIVGIIVFITMRGIINKKGYEKNTLKYEIEYCEIPYILLYEENEDSNIGDVLAIKMSHNKNDKNCFYDVCLSGKGDVTAICEKYDINCSIIEEGMYYAALSYEQIVTISGEGVLCQYIGNGKEVNSDKKQGFDGWHEGVCDKYGDGMIWKNKEDVNNL